jgi:NB-ARC domain
MAMPQDPQERETEQQTNREDTKGWQTRVEGGTAYIADVYNYQFRDRARTPTPFQAPPLPSNYVDCPEHRQAVKAKLLETERNTPGTLVISAIFGLGGVGKSLLATALAHDQDVQNHFPDGILWTTLGQQPDVLPFLSSWIQALGDYDYKPITIDEATLHLRTLLYDKKALLVVDDVWNSDHLEPFRVGGIGCRVLVTTREARIPDADRYHMDVMTPDQSLGLLLQKAQCLKPTLAEQQQAEALAKEVGYLPLALELAGAQIADGAYWTIQQSRQLVLRRIANASACLPRLT